MMQKIGVFGGSFNPIHTGHLVMAQDVYEQFGLSKVLFIPAKIPPHKQGHHLIAAEDRLAMIQAAIQGDARFEVWDGEIKRGGVSYSVDTVRQLKTLYPNAELFFIIGGDTLVELHTWKDIYDLFELCEFVTITRPGFIFEELSGEQLQLKDPWPKRLVQNIILGHLVEISSTDIRMRASKGLSIRYLVPRGVELYIQERKLYQIQEKQSSKH